MRDAVLALWHIDNHHNVFRATELLLGDHVTLEPGWEYKVARAVSDGWPSGTEALHYIRSLALEPSTVEECSLLVRIYLQCNAWEEAFQLQRSLCQLFLSRGATPMIVKQLRSLLISQCCEHLLQSTNEGTTSILRLPVNESEEEYLMEFYVRKAFGHGRVNVTHMGILLAHLLYHSKVVEAKCIEAIANKMKRDNSNGSNGSNGSNVDDYYEAKMISLSKIMKRFQHLSPIASKIRQSKTVRAVTLKYERVASDLDIMSALHDLIDPTYLIQTMEQNEQNEQNEQKEHIYYDVEEDGDEDMTMSNAPDPSSGERNGTFPTSSSASTSGSGLSFRPSLAPLGSSSYPHQGLGTPKKSLLSVAASSGVEAFRKQYSPSMLSPVVQGMSPFTSNDERQVKASYAKKRGVTSSPSIRSRTAVLTTRKSSKLKSELKAEENLQGGGLFRLTQ